MGIDETRRRGEPGYMKLNGKSAIMKGCKTGKHKQEETSEKKTKKYKGSVNIILT